MRRDGGYRFGPRYHVLMDAWTTFCGSKPKVPVGVNFCDIGYEPRELDKRATKAHMAVCARCLALLERKASR